MGHDSFDVFLSHNSQDKPAVRALADALLARGVIPWLDERELVPGRPWQEALEEIIETVPAAVVLVGSDGFGPWHDREMRASLSEFVDRKAAVIPVLLPGAPNRPKLPLFLKAFTWVDLRGGLTDEGLEKLVWGITGEKAPSATPSISPSTVPTSTHRLPRTGGNFVGREKELARLDEAWTDSSTHAIGSQEMAQELVSRAVTVVDLSRYSDIIKEVEQHFSAAAVAEINQQIQAFIREALASTGVSRQGLPYKTTGDGAILALASAESACRFSEALHRAAAAHNSCRDVPLAQRHFRIGIFTGDVLLQPSDIPGNGLLSIELAGLAISNAVRFEGQAKTGEVLISPETWAQLPASRRQLYGPAETIHGKRNERFKAHRRKVADRAPWERQEEREPGSGENTSSKKRRRLSATEAKNFRRRIRKLREKAALMGPDLPIRDQLEIEDIERILDQQGVAR